MEVLRQLQHKTVPLHQRIAFIAPPTGEEAEAHVFMSAAVTQNIQKLPSRRSSSCYEHSGSLCLTRR